MHQRLLWRGGHGSEDKEFGIEYEDVESVVKKVFPSLLLSGA